MTDITAEPFHQCALTAFVEIWRETGSFPPDSEAVRVRAYRYYEEGLANKSIASKDALCNR